MKKLIFLAILLTGCASSRVNVDFDSCQSRGVLDGVKVSSCETVKNVK
jgi:hypothetical protein